ncbi:MAG TPA: CocE/NonD family hydrolase [Mycobacteriales bacterium]|nr:CocE/NonD family hydrolase [Mycobacteriales bacterium]
MRPNRHARRPALRSIACLAALLASFAVAVDTAAASPHVHATRLVATGSVNEVFATGVAPGSTVELTDAAGQVVKKKHADSLGGVVFYKVKAASGYRVRAGSTTSKAVTVHTKRSAPWDPSVYDQSIPDAGYGYITMRDGTKLAYDVHPPTSPASLGLPNITLPSGLPDYAPPYPTLIEYSGYGYAEPSGPENGIAVIANLMGFAVVDVNMRGTGCSGGAFNFFEPLQSLDGYDVIQTIARQPWVKGHKVGMMGISYGGISQLFTAATRPPALAAIAPMSVIDATATTLEPGGILNTGFAVAWAEERQQNAEPAVNAKSGQAWAYQRIQAGDETCKANQVLHGEAENLMAVIRANTHYHKAFADSLDPDTFVHKIDVPTYLDCQFEDEQTGGHCMALAQHFTGTKHKWFTFTNGVHFDSLDPYQLDRMYDFLELYVAHQAPILNAAVINAAAPVIYQQGAGFPTTDLITLPPDPIQLEPTYSAALAAFQKIPSIRVLFENGAGPDPLGTVTPGNPYPVFERSFAKFPIPGTVAKRWYFGPHGTLATHAATSSGVDSYTSNAHALPMNDFGPDNESGGLWGDATQWSWNWKQNPKGTAVSYITPPLKQATTVIGAGAIHVWVRSSTPDVDLQATVSEVDPGGHEVFVQNGWIRASERKLATGKNTIFAQRSTLLQPVPSFKESDSAAMPKGKFVEVTIPLYYEGHAYHAGSRIRVTIAAPNGTQPIWSFKHTEPPTGTSHVSIAFSKTRPSSLFLPVVPGVSVPSGIPACGSLRNEPCRPYVPTANQL